MSIGTLDNKATNLISTPLTLTSSFQDIGDVIVVGDHDLAALWVNLDINDSSAIQFRAVGSDTEAFTVSYNLPTQDITASLTSVEAQLIQLTNDLDQKIILPFSISDAIPFIKFQVKATSVGSTAGQLLTAKVSAKTTGR